MSKRMDSACLYGRHYGFYWHITAIVYSVRIWTIPLSMNEYYGIRLPIRPWSWGRKIMVPALSMKSGGWYTVGEWYSFSARWGQKQNTHSQGTPFTNSNTHIQFPRTSPAGGSGKRTSFSSFFDNCESLSLRFKWGGNTQQWPMTIIQWSWRQ